MAGSIVRYEPYSNLGDGGGAVTQRIANPRRQVRLLSVAPNFFIVVAFVAMIILKFPHGNQSSRWLTANVLGVRSQWGDTTFAS